VGTSAAHSARPAHRGLRLAGAAAGVAAIAASIGVAVPTLLGGPAPAAGTLTTARYLTVAVAPAVIPLSDAELADLVGRPLHLGVLEDAGRLSSCLGGLGYPASTAVLGAETVEINGRSAVLLLVAADDPSVVNVLAVATHCSVADTGLLADTDIPRP
jgi:hypothetical protein